MQAPRLSSCQQEARLRQRHEAPEWYTSMERVAAAGAACHNLMLVCKDGELPVSADVLRLASPVVLEPMIEEALKQRETEKSDAAVCKAQLPQLKVDATVDAWAAALSPLYAFIPQPSSLAVAATYLPVAHKYGMSELLAWTCTHVRNILRKEASLDNVDDGYLLRWLLLFEQLQLDNLIDTCLDCVRGMQSSFQQAMGSGSLNDDLAKLSSRLAVKVVRAAYEKSNPPGQSTHVPKGRNTGVSPLIIRFMEWLGLWVEL